jgi:hypothetical protein
MRNAIIGAVGVLLAAIPAAGNAQIGAGTGTGPGSGTATAVPPGAAIGGTGGAAMGSPRPYYREYAHRDRVCWHERGYRHCRWR